MSQPNSKLFDNKYYYTYHFAAAVSSALDTAQESALHIINEFFLDDDYVFLLGGFAEKSLLHHFISFIGDREFNHADVDEETAERLAHLADHWILDAGLATTTWIEDAFKRFELRHESFTEFMNNQGKTLKQVNIDNLFDYYTELRLSGPAEDLYDLVAEEVFWIIFQNRELLRNFNLITARHRARTQARRG